MRRPAKLYNLDAIISVGYRVNSRRATRFRIWATGVLKEYMTKDFVLDDERLKQGKGKVTNRKAREKAEAEYAMFNPTQKIVSDFDKAVKKQKPE